MFESLQHRHFHYLLLVALSFFLFFLNLGGASLWDLDEGRNTNAAFEMMESGNWIVPTFNAQLRVDKPALLYWLQIGAYRLFGVNEFAGRLPSALAALATVLLCYELARSMFGKRTGLLAGVVVASTPMLAGAARFANPDALLNLFTVLTFTLFWLGKDRPSTGWFAAMGAAAGLAVLAKGPVGIVMPVAVIGLYLLWERRLKLLWDLRLSASFWALFFVAAPWYIWVAVETKGQFVREFIGNHNVGRFTSAMENHGGSPLYYVVVLLVGLVPWSIFLGPMAWYSFWSTLRTPWRRTRETWEAAAERSPESYRLLACWVVVYLVFFTIAATKLPNYVLPVVVPCAILTARFLERWRLGELRVPAWTFPGSILCLVLLGIGLGVGLAIAGGVGPIALSHGRAFPGLGAWAALGLVPVVGGLLGAWLLTQQRRAAFIVAVACSGVLLLAPLAAYGSALFDRFKAARPLVEQAGAFQRQADIRVGAWQVEHLPSLNFYLQRGIVHLKSGAEVATLLEYPLPVYVFLPEREWNGLPADVRSVARVAGRHDDIYRNQTIVVVTNR